MKTAELNKKCREYTAELVEAVKKKKDDRRLLEYFEFCSRFHYYSFHNRMLIWVHRPDATFVAGFKAWQEMGRSVRKGEKGIPILAPMRVKGRKGQEREPETGTEEIEGEGKGQQSERKNILRFKVVSVWDVSQTDGDPLPETPDILTVEGELGSLLSSLEAVVADKGIKLEYVDTLPIASACGLSSGGAVKIIASMTGQERFHVLAHELAHELLHDPQKRIELSRKVKELEAEATAFVVGRHFGLESKAPTYLALYRVEEVDIIASLDRIVSTASSMIRWIIRQAIKDGLEKAA